MNTNYPGLEQSQGQPGDQMLPDDQDKHFLSSVGLGSTLRHKPSGSPRAVSPDSQSRTYSDNLHSTRSPGLRWIFFINNWLHLVKPFRLDLLVSCIQTDYISHRTDGDDQ